MAFESLSFEEDTEKLNKEPQVGESSAELNKAEVQEHIEITFDIKKWVKKLLKLLREALERGDLQTANRIRTLLRITPEVEEIFKDDSNEDAVVNFLEEQIKQKDEDISREEEQSDDKDEDEELVNEKIENLQELEKMVEDEIQKFKQQQEQQEKSELQNNQLKETIEKVDTFIESIDNKSESDEVKPIEERDIIRDEEQTSTTALAKSSTLFSKETDTQISPEQNVQEDNDKEIQDIVANSVTESTKTDTNEEKISKPQELDETFKKNSTQKQYLNNPFSIKEDTSKESENNMNIHELDNEAIEQADETVDEEKKQNTFEQTQANAEIHKVITPDASEVLLKKPNYIDQQVSQIEENPDTTSGVKEEITKEEFNETIKEVVAKEDINAFEPRIVEETNQNNAHDMVPTNERVVSTNDLIAMEEQSKQVEGSLTNNGPKRVTPVAPVPQQHQVKQLKLQTQGQAVNKQQVINDSKTTLKKSKPKKKGLNLLEHILAAIAFIIFGPFRLLIRLTDTFLKNRNQ